MSIFFWDSMPGDATEASIRENTRGGLKRLLLELNAQAAEFNSTYNEALTLREFYNAYYSGKTLDPNIDSD